MKQNRESIEERSVPIQWQQLLSVFAGVCLLTSLVRYFAGNLGNLMTEMILLPTAFLFTGMVLLNRKVRRQSEVRILVGLLALVFISSAANEKFYGVFVENRSYIGLLVVSVFTCYALFFLLPSEKRITVLHALIAICTAAVTAVCVWGLVLMVSGTYFIPRFQPEYGIGLCPQNVGMGADFRLVVFTHPNTVGMVCEIVFLLSLYRVLTAKKTLTKILYACAAAVCFLAIAAASSRTSSLAVSIGAAMMAFRALYLRLREKKKLFRFGIAAATAIITAVFCFILLSALYDGMLSLSAAGRSEAALMTDAERVVADETSAFSGRTNIWKGVLQCMADTPRLFFIGTSPVNVGHVIADYSPIWVQEVHSSFVQMLISCGVLCPLLFLVFVLLLAIRGVRQFFQTAVCVHSDVGMLVPVLVAILISACMETFLLLYQQLHFANLWFFLLAGYVAASDSGTEVPCESCVSPIIHIYKN